MTAMQSQPAKRKPGASTGAGGTAKAGTQEKETPRLAQLLTPRAEAAVKRATRSLDLVVRPGIEDADGGSAPRLVRRARTRTITALDAVLADDNPLWQEDRDGRRLKELDYSVVEGLLSDALIDYLEDNGYTPPPPAWRLVEDVSDAIHVLQSETEAELSRDDLSEVARDRLRTLRSAIDGLDLTPDATSPVLLMAKKVLVAMMMGTVALSGQVAEGVVVDMVKDVVKASAFYSVVVPHGDDQDDTDDEEAAGSSEREALEIAILQAELRKVEAEARLAEALARGDRR